MPLLLGTGRDEAERTFEYSFERDQLRKLSISAFRRSRRNRMARLSTCRPRPWTTPRYGRSYWHITTTRHTQQWAFPAP